MVSYTISDRALSGQLTAIKSIETGPTICLIRVRAPGSNTEEPQLSVPFFLSPRFVSPFEGDFLQKGTQMKLQCNFSSNPAKGDSFSSANSRYQIYDYIELFLRI